MQSIGERMKDDLALRGMSELTIESYLRYARQFATFLAKPPRRASTEGVRAFISASDLLLDLAGQESPRALERKLRHYAKIGLLAVDEVGFLSFDTRNADLFYQLVSRRHERKSLVLTTNLAFNQWATVFPNATCATALIERVVHHADIVTIEGESYRVRESQEEATKRRDERAGRRRGARDTK